MRKTKAAFVLFILMAMKYVYAGEISENYFIWPNNNRININEYTIIIAGYGTFYTGITDLKPRLEIYCISGIKDGINVSLENTAVTVGITFLLSLEQTRRLRNNFKNDFLDGGYSELI